MAVPEPLRLQALFRLDPSVQAETIVCALPVED